MNECGTKPDACQWCGDLALQCLVLVPAPIRDGLDYLCIFGVRLRSLYCMSVYCFHCKVFYTCSHLLFPHTSFTMFLFIKKKLSHPRRDCFPASLPSGPTVMTVMTSHTHSHRHLYPGPSSVSADRFAGDGNSRKS